MKPCWTVALRQQQDKGPYDRNSSNKSCRHSSFPKTSLPKQLENEAEKNETRVNVEKKNLSQTPDSAEGPSTKGVVGRIRVEGESMGVVAGSHGTIRHCFHCA